MGTFVPGGVHVLHFGGAVLDWRGRLMAGPLDLGDDALVTARSAAAALHRLDGFDEGPLQFLVPRWQRRRRAAGDVTSAPALMPLDRLTVEGLRVTSGTRTVLELLERRFLQLLRAGGLPRPAVQRIYFFTADDVTEGEQYVTATLSRALGRAA